MADPFTPRAVARRRLRQALLEALDIAKVSSLNVIDIQQTAMKVFAEWTSREIGHG